jgi:hypothetical protein
MGLVSGTLATSGHSLPAVSLFFDAGGSVGAREFRPVSGSAAKSAGHCPVGPEKLACSMQPENLLSPEELEQSSKPAFVDIDESWPPVCCGRPVFSAL